MKTEIKGRPLPSLTILCLILSAARAWIPQTCRISVKTAVSVSHAHDCHQHTDFLIRDGLFGEMGQAADVILKSFYVNATSPWKQLYRMGELNRLQQGFPHGGDRSRHRMLVAVSKIDGEEQIVGFCDVDARVPNRPTGYSYNPRPYISDLCIDPHWRRRGIAKALVEVCESFCIEQVSRDEIFIRVESNNEAAVSMYKRMGYDQIENPDDPKGVIILLRKCLAVTEPILRKRFV